MQTKKREDRYFRWAVGKEKRLRDFIHSRHLELGGSYQANFVCGIVLSIVSYMVESFNA